MTTQLVLRVVGPDRPGLVSALSDAVAAQGGNWLTSQLAQLAGTFAGIVLIDLPADNIPGLEEAVRHLDEDGLLDVVISESSAQGDSAGEQPGVELSLHLMGQDHPGIVRDVTQVLAEQRVTIESFTSEVFAAPQSGGQLFEATIEARVPADADVDALTHALEALAEELMVDLSLDSSE